MRAPGLARAARTKRLFRVLIERDQLIVGMPAVEARSVVRMFHEWAHSTRGFAEARSVDVAEAGALIGRLVHAGLIEPTEFAGPSVFAGDETVATAGTLWRTTIAGAALAKARIGKPMSRAKAQALLDGFIERAQAVNGDPDALYAVAEVVLYGSFASAGDGAVGDVDVGVRLRPRYEPDELFRRQALMIAADGARPSGMTALAYAEVKVMRLLRGGSSRIDLLTHDEHHPLPPGALSRVVYREGPA